jgi:hypothetical protein
MTRPPRPSDLTAWLDAAAAQYAAGRWDEAARLYRRAETAAPADVRAIYSLAVIDIRRGRPAPARERLSRVVRRDPNLFAAQQNLGAVCQALGLWDEAAEAYARALALRPDALDTAFARARALAVLGRLEDAVAAYRALMTEPTSRLRALTRLVILEPDAATDEDREALRQGAADPALDDETRTGLMFALGEALERRGETAAAFDAFEAGNRMKHAALSAAPDPRDRPDAVARGHEHAARFVMERFAARSPAAPRARASGSAAPIFIVGMPRSGSSLIEQILAAHRKVQGLGESPVLSDLTDRFLGEGGEPDARALAEAYLDAMRARGWRGTPRLVDKTLENYLRVGLIDRIFPRAVVLHCVRDPVDTGLACYRQLFASGNETLYDLRQIGEAYVRYRQVMAHWDRVLPGRVIEVSHETLVADPEGQIRWLVTEACGLDWDPACLDFHKAEGAVRTASAAQVRRPIFTSSLQRWRRYEDRLGPLLEALGPYAPEL